MFSSIICGEVTMRVTEEKGLKITVGEDGFLVNIDDWSGPVARVLAAREGIADMTEARLDIRKFMREYYGKHHFFPIVRVCKNVPQRNNCVTEQFIDLVKAWKIAGLPNPGEEVIMFKAWEPLGY
jgi:TusE/DsrC/DsvC family sulfur relay protein